MKNEGYVTWVERHVVRRGSLYYKPMRELTYQAKLFYNQANFYVRQNFIRNKVDVCDAEGVVTKRHKFLPYYVKGSKDCTYRIMRNHHEELYKRDEPSSTSEQLLRILNKNWKSFFVSIKDWKKHPEKYLGRPKLPKYKKKQMVYPLKGSQVRVKDGRLHFCKHPRTGEPILQSIKTKVGNVQAARIVPKATCIILEVIYRKEKEPYVAKKGVRMGIDLGVNNLASCAYNQNIEPFLINGRPLKSLNQYYNKHRAHHMSYVGNKGRSRKLEQALFKRTEQVENYLHQASHRIVQEAIDHGVETIVIGHNVHWKQEANMGKRNNQTFLNIPHASLIQKIKYKAELYGIEVLETDEAYTSKTSFLDREPIERRDKYVGRRVKRGLFRSAKGVWINADINAALNLLRKVFPKDFIRGDSGCASHPRKLNIAIS